MYKIRKISAAFLSILLMFSLCACEITEEDVSAISEIAEILTEETQNTEAYSEVISENSITENEISEEETSIETGVTGASISSEESSVEESEELNSEKDNEEDFPEAEEKYYSFRNNKLLSQHYDKHGKDMGFASSTEYETAANLVINNPDSLHKLEKEDGDDIYYLEATNEFVVVSTDGYIRTYFCPDSGIKYYNKQ